MAKIIKYMPELTGDEQIEVARLMTDMTEAEAEQFAHVYRSRRKDETVTLLTALLGFLVVAGVHRFYLNQIGMGLLYLFTGGLCFVGTIVDLFNHKALTFQYNRQVAHDVARLIHNLGPGEALPPSSPGELPPSEGPATEDDDRAL